MDRCISRRDAAGSVLERQLDGTRSSGGPARLAGQVVNGRTVELGSRCAIGPRPQLVGVVGVVSGCGGGDEVVMMILAVVVVS